MHDVDLTRMDRDPAGAAKLGAFPAFAMHPRRIAEQQYGIDRLNARCGGGEQTRRACPLSASPSKSSGRCFAS